MFLTTDSFYVASPSIYQSTESLGSARKVRLWPKYAPTDTRDEINGRLPATFTVEDRKTKNLQFWPCSAQGSHCICQEASRLHNIVYARKVLLSLSGFFPTIVRHANGPANFFPLGRIWARPTYNPESFSAALLTPSRSVVKHTEVLGFGAPNLMSVDEIASLLHF